MNNFQKYCLEQIGWPRLLLALATAVLAWSAVLLILRNDWMIDPQYGYGFLVPLLVLGLLWRRGQDFHFSSTPGSGAVLCADAAALCSALLLAGVIPMAEANPDWRVLGILASFAALGISLAMILQLGGWCALRHFAFPLCFFLIAVPWPRNFEQSVMTTLVSWNARTTIEMLHWLGYEAMSRGNLIVLPAGVLGIEEACSGIRSLQGGLMVALFFGEYFRLGSFRRLFLIFAALFGAMLGNFLRSSFLAVVASSHGMSAVSSWHGPAGFLVLFITVSSVACCALFWKNQKNVTGTADGAKEMRSFPYPPPFRSVSLATLVAIAAILLFSNIGTEYWYRSHERAFPVASGWDLYPRSGAEVMPVVVPDTTLKLLFDPVGFSEKWRRKGGETGQVFYFRWPSGRIAVQSILAMHNPEVCLSNIGMKMETQLDPVTVKKEGITLKFHAWLFDQNGHSVYVFNAMILNVQVPEDVLRGLDDSPGGRFKSLLAGLRNNGQRMIEIAFWNLPDEEAARKALVFYLNEASVKPQKVTAREEIKI